MAEFFSKLGIGVDSTQVKKGSEALKDFERAAGGAETASGKFSGAARGIGIGIGAGVAALTALTAKVISSTNEQQAAFAQLERGVELSAGRVGRTVAQLQAEASRLQSITLFGDEQIIEAQARLLSFQNITEDVFDRATQAALDLSTRMGTDLNSSILQIGKALQDPATGLTALTRSGTTFTDQQKEMVKALVESGRTLDAQRFILDELERQYEGSARAARDTLGGALKGLQNAFGDLFEAGPSESAEELRLNIERLAATISSPEFAAGAASIANGLLSITSGLSELIAQIPTAISFLDQLENAFVWGDQSDSIAGIEIRIDSLREKLEGLRNQERMFGAGTQSAVIAQVEAEIASLAAQQRELLDVQTQGIVKTREGSAATKASAVAFKASSVAVKAVTTEMSAQEKAWQSLIGSLEERIALFGLETEEAQLSAEIQLGLYGKLSDADKERVLGLARTIDAQEAAKKAADELAKSTLDYKRSTDDLIRQSLPDQERQLMAVREAMLRLNIAAEEFPERADEINRAIANLAQDEADILAGSTEQLSTYGEQAAKNIQDAFAEFLFDPFEDGLDGMLDSFISIIKTMVSQAAAADIAAAIGLPGAGKGGNLAGIFGSLGGGGSLGSGLISGASSLAGTSLFKGTGVGDFLGSLGTKFPGINKIGTPGALGAGLIGSTLGGAVFGGQAGIGSTLGGLAGSYFGAPGAAIGSFLGSGLDSLGGDGKNKTLFAGVTAGQSAGFENRTSATATGASGLEFGAVSRRLGVDGERLAADLLAQFLELDSVLTQGVRTLGGTVDLSGKSLSGGGVGKSGTSFFGSAQDVEFDPAKMAQAPVEFFRAWIAEVSKSVDDELAASLAGLQGDTLDALLAGFNVEIQKRAIPEQLKSALGAQDQAQKDIAAAARTATDMLGDQVAEVYRLADAYDGSIESHNALVEALAVEQDMARALAYALEDASTQISVMIGGLRNQIEESLLSEDQLYNRRKSQIDDLVATLNTASDPTRILETVRQIEQLTATVWNSLADDQQSAMGAGFLEFLDGVEALSQERIDAAFGDLDSTANGIFNAVSTAMSPASAAAVEAANTQLEASNAILQSAAIFNNAAGSMLAAAAAFASARQGGEVVYQ